VPTAVVAHLIVLAVKHVLAQSYHTLLGDFIRKRFEVTNHLDVCRHVDCPVEHCVVSISGQFLALLISLFLDLLYSNLVSFCLSHRDYLLPDIIYISHVLYVELGLTGVSGDEGEDIVEVEMSHVFVHGELHVFNPVFAKVMVPEGLLIVLEEVSLRLIKPHNEVIEVAPVDVASSVVVDLLPLSDEVVDVQSLDGCVGCCILLDESVHHDSNEEIQENLANHYLIGNEVEPRQSGLSATLSLVSSCVVLLIGLVLDTLVENRVRLGSVEHKLIPGFTSSTSQQ